MKVIKLLRVPHWLKNFLIFVPCFFNGNIFNFDMFCQTVIGALGFALMTSAIYIINDICDYDKDKLHPYKCKRPIASGDVSKKQAVVISIVLFSISIFLVFISCGFLLGVWIIYFIYFTLNILYSVFNFKEKALIDIYILSSGFLLRVFYGALLNDIVISSWLYLVVLFGAMYLGLAKRRGELRDLRVNTKREVLRSYNDGFLTMNMYLTLTASIVFYSLWCSNNLQYIGLIWSIPMLVLIILRYNLLIEKDGSSGDPIEVILKDRQIFIFCLIYMGYLFTIFYLPWQVIYERV